MTPPPIPDEEREDETDRSDRTLRHPTGIAESVRAALATASREGRAASIHVFDLYTGDFGNDIAGKRTLISVPQWLAGTVLEWCELEPRPAMTLTEWVAAMAGIEENTEPDGLWRMLQSVDAKADALKQVAHDFGFTKGAP